VKPPAQVLGVEANAVTNAKRRQLAALDQSVDGGAAEPEQSCNIRHPEQLVRAKVPAAAWW